MTLYELFFWCVTARYQKIGGEANFALHREGRTLYVFFEGSNGGEDWQINLNFPARAYRRGGAVAWYAHRGFLELWKTTEPYISGALLDPELDNVVIAGYSHGGAVAMLCHEYVWYNRPDLRDGLDGYGFGAPRVFWGIPTKAMSRRWERFTVVRNLDDAVTHLPPKILGYSHVGKMLEIGGVGRYSVIDAHRAENILHELKAYTDK